MSEALTWRAAGPSPDGAGLLALEGLDAAGTVVRRVAADIRGGVSWPFPRVIGTELVAAGYTAVVAFIPPRDPAPGGLGSAVVLRSSPCTSVTLVRAPDGWPKDLGVVGRVRSGAAELGCMRWYAFARADEHDEAMRVMRTALAAELPHLRITNYQDAADLVKLAREAVWRWSTSIGFEMNDTELRTVEEEETEYGGQGPFALTLAVGAALHGYGAAPWRPRREAPWEAIPEGIVNQPLHV